MQMGAFRGICTPATPCGRPVRSPATEWGLFLNFLVAISPFMCGSHPLLQYTHSFSSNHIVAVRGSHESLPVLCGGAAFAKLVLKIDAAPKRKRTSIVARVAIPRARDSVEGGGHRHLTVVISTADGRPLIASISRQLRQTIFELWRADLRCLACGSRASACGSRRIFSRGNLRSSWGTSFHH